MRGPKSEIYTTLFITIWSILMVDGKTPKCNPEDNKYYHSQALTCFQCEKCLKGDEVIPMERWSVRNWNPETGPTECRPCNKCRPGTYSDSRSYECRVCKNCTLYGQYKTAPCTHMEDTVCDGNLPPTEVKEKPKSMKTEGQLSGGNGNSHFIIIAGLICFTVIILVTVTAIYLHKGKGVIFTNSGKATENTEGKSGENSLSQSLKEINSCSDHRIIEIPPSNDEISPLLEPTDSLASDSHAFNPSTSPCLWLGKSQESLCVDGNDKVNPDHCKQSKEVSNCPVQETTETCSLNSMDLKSETFQVSLESLSTEDSNQDNPDQEKSPPLDGDSNQGGSFARKIHYERQWSYPIDGKRERDYFLHTALAPVPCFERESNIDVTVIPKDTKNVTEELTEKDLWKASRYLVPNKLYISVVRELGLLDIDIQTVELDNKKESITEIAYQTLLQLKKKKGCIMKDTFKKAITHYDQEAWNNIISCH